EPDASHAEAEASQPEPAESQPEVEASQSQAQASHAEPTQEEDADGNITEVYEAIDANEFAEERPSQGGDRAELKALLEAVIYVTDEPLTLQQIAAAVSHPVETVRE